MAQTGSSSFDRLALYFLGASIVLLYAIVAVRTFLPAPHEAAAAPRQPVRMALLAPDDYAPSDVQALEYAFAGHAYTLNEVKEGRPVPRLYLTSLPKDIGEIDSSAERKRVFIKLMLPLVLRANEEVAARRERLLQLDVKRLVGQPPTPEEAIWLERLAADYGLDKPDLATLKSRVDVIPPSLALAQAAEESGWGTSRFALEGNALFGQRTVVTTDAQAVTALTPAQSEAGEAVRVRTFDALQASVSQYLHNLNTHAAYRALRNARAKLRDGGRDLDPQALAAYLQRYSERGPAYVKTIRTIIEQNKLTAFDGASLHDPDAGT